MLIDICCHIHSVFAFNSVFVSKIFISNYNFKKI